ncbi:MAG: cell wall-binding repeat-containing protein [Desulfitobacteriaceae bacterium]
MNFFTRKILPLLCGVSLILTMIPQQLSAETPAPLITRIFGATLYDTAIEISQAGWSQSTPTVVLATGQNFPDALAGTVLAGKLNSPLLLTESTQLPLQVLDELVRLQAQKIYLLGGTSAISDGIETTLRNKGYEVSRLWGIDQYGTAARIASELVQLKLNIETSVGESTPTEAEYGVPLPLVEVGVSRLDEVTPSSTQAFLVTGERFADALSISSYAAAHGIPLLMTKPDKIPTETLKALTQLGVRQVTLIGGTGIIMKSVEDQLVSLPNPIQVTDRLAGYDQYETNTLILEHLSYDSSNIYVATGKNFPDALAGAALAAKNNQPVLLIPPTAWIPSTTNYVNDQRSAGAGFTILGGLGAISYGGETMIRTGSVHPRISLQYIQGSSFSGQLDQLSVIPSPNTDYVDIISPSWYTLNDAPTGQTSADGSLSGIWDSSTSNYNSFAAKVHSINLKILPKISASWDSTKPLALDSVLPSPSARANLENQLVQRINSTGVDGIVIDFELMDNAAGPGLTLFMQELAAKLHPLNKLVVMAVMSKTGTESWLGELNYHDLAMSVDYLHLMTYDYRTSVPGPNAPLDWINKVLKYTSAQGVDMQKILLGIPYYGSDWTTTTTSGKPPSYTVKHLGLGTIPGFPGATETLSTFNAALKRDASQIPNFTYKDASGKDHTVYYDDPLSWNAKLTLLDQYNLGGIGAWSLFWFNSDTANQFFPLLKLHIR